MLPTNCIDIPVCEKEVSRLDGKRRNIGMELLAILVRKSQLKWLQLLLPPQCLNKIVASVGIAVEYVRDVLFRPFRQADGTVC